MTRAAWIAQQHGRKAVLYVVRLTSRKESFFKVGVTFDFSACWTSFAPFYRRKLLARRTSSNALLVWEEAKRLCKTASYFPHQPLADLPDKTRCYTNITWVLAALA